MSASTQDMTPRTTEPLGPAEVGSSHEVPARSGADPNRSTPPYPSGYVRGARMVRLEGFEEPFRMAEPERETYHRRFGILFVDDSSARRGGLGTVVRAQDPECAGSRRARGRCVLCGSRRPCAHGVSR